MKTVTCQDRLGTDIRKRSIEKRGVSAAGKSEAIGVSNFEIDDLSTLARTPRPDHKPRVTPALNQCKLSVVHHDDATIVYCRQQGITYQSYSPLCGGFNGSSCSRGKKTTPFLRCHIIPKIDHFTKTGSGQT
jgi:diketogulonate reductase-like aldo/keto reductase|eukprot:COSAG06_NODE_299_length_18009_cov_6.715952_20_plen_132_part_00